MLDNPLVGLTAIIVLGVGAQWLAWRLKLPAIIALLVVGVLAGPVSGFLRPDKLFGEVLFPIISLAVALILFEGGLSLRLRDLKEIGAVMRNLMTLGVLLTWVLSALAAHYLAGLQWGLSALLGALLVVTGPTVIIPLLKHVRPRGAAGLIAKWEGIVNDPIGAILAVLVFEALLVGGEGGILAHGLRGLLEAAVAGLLCGLAGALVVYMVLKRRWAPDYLQNPVALMAVLAAFAASNVMSHESGLLAVTVMGIALANQKRVAVQHIVEFKENLRVLLISSLFILLAARLQVADLEQLDLGSLLFVGALIVFVRPVSVWFSTIGMGLTWRERAFLAWMAPRGIVAAAVSAVFAIDLVAAGYADAARLAPLTFLVIVATVAVYGLTAAPLARALGLAQSSPQGVVVLGASDLGRAVGVALRELGFAVLMVDANYKNISVARMAGLPTYYGSAVSEHILDEIDLDGIGRLLALTTNDEANSLAALRFSEVFDNGEIYQLPPNNMEEGLEEGKVFTPQHLRGRFLFAADANASALARRLGGGAQIKTTSLTETFSHADFIESYGEGALPLFGVDAEGGLHVFTTDGEVLLQAGMTVVALVGGEGAE